MDKNSNREQAKKLFEEGKSYSEISRNLNISESTLKSWKRRDGWQRATPPKKKVTKKRNTKKVASKGLQPKKVIESTDGFDKIKSNLLSQLKKNGTYSDMYIDLVNDYMKLWRIKNKLIDDIEVRGVQVETYNSSGQKIYKKNDSVVELPKYNSQMLKLLNDLGLSALNYGDGDGDEV